MGALDFSGLRQNATVAIGETVYLGETLPDDVTINGRRYLAGGFIETDPAKFDVNIFTEKGIVAVGSDVDHLMSFPVTYRRPDNGDTYLFGTHGSGLLYLTKDDGVTWNTFAHQQSTFQMKAMVLNTDTGRIFIGGTSGAAAYSDNGETFIDMTSPFGGPTSMDRFTFGNGIIMAGRSGSIAYSSNNGASWTTVNTGVDSGQGLIFFNNQFVTCGQGVFKTSPDGAVWTETERVLGGAGASYYMDCSSTLAIAVSTIGGCLISTNGTTWQAKSTPVAFSNIKYLPASDRFICASGADLYTTSDGIAWNKLSRLDGSLFCYDVGQIGNAADKILLSKSGVSTESTIQQFAGSGAEGRKGSCKKFVRIS